MKYTYKIHPTDHSGKPTWRYWKLIYNAALRLGVSIPTNDIVNLEFDGDEWPNDQETGKKHDPHNVRLVGRMTINHAAFDDIVFIHNTKYDRPKFRTFWPKSEDERASDSTVEPLVTLALKGEPISPDKIVSEMHPEFRKNPGIDPLILLNRAKNVAEEQASELLRLAEAWKDEAIASAAREERLAEEYIQLENEKKLLDFEIERLKAEKVEANLKGETVVENAPLLLISVETNVSIRNSLNTVLTFENGSQKTMKVSTFDPNLLITEKAKSLVGRRVITTCWDPISQPGKWSSLNYFRNVYEDI